MAPFTWFDAGAIAFVLASLVAVLWADIRRAVADWRADV
jgi:hypothetical protein